MTQREIKFRAWYSYSKKMLDLGDLETICIRQKAETIDYDFANYEVMQFTGLKDKNGKEVYEGDIVKFVDGCAYDGNIGIVKFGIYDNGSEYEDRVSGNGWYLEIITGWLGAGEVKDLSDTKYEIIGNIFGNPDLLIKPFKLKCINTQ